MLSTVGVIQGFYPEFVWCYPIVPLLLITVPVCVCPRDVYPQFGHVIANLVNLHHIVNLVVHLADVVNRGCFIDVARM